MKEGGREGKRVRICAREATAVEEVVVRKRGREGERESACARELDLVEEGVVTEEEMTDTGKTFEKKVGGEHEKRVVLEERRENGHCD